MAACERLAGITGLTIDGTPTWWFPMSPGRRATGSAKLWSASTACTAFPKCRSRALSRRPCATSARSASATSTPCAASRSWSPRQRQGHRRIEHVEHAALEVRAAEGTFQVRFDGIDRFRAITIHARLAAAQSQWPLTAWSARSPPSLPRVPTSIRRSNSTARSSPPCTCRSPPFQEVRTAEIELERVRVRLTPTLSALMR